MSNHTGPIVRGLTIVVYLIFCRFGCPIMCNTLVIFSFKLRKHTPRVFSSKFHVWSGLSHGPFEVWKYASVCLYIFSWDAVVNSSILVLLVALIWLMRYGAALTVRFLGWAWVEQWDTCFRTWRLWEHCEGTLGLLYWICFLANWNL